ncbi:hypothetical protein [Spirosoma sp.]|uniref:hypothetical protein n=1 Tax=Spirosoma sp. TaxID=1899569 RepID=UPI00261B9710|nr:hypothetical protein [Spirosoma sp.]MCX6218354.1 hypothetical protein [Spirosoma sp.]
MNESEMAARFRALALRLPELGVELMTEVAETGVSVMEARSIDTGIDADGRPGNKAKYSEKKVPSYFLKGQELNQSGKKYLDENKRVNWYGLRQAQGLKSQDVNLTYTGEMWKQYGVLSVTVSNGKVSARVGISGDRAAVFVANIKRYGAFYRNTPEELANRQQDIQRGTANWLKLL